MHQLGAIFPRHVRERVARDLRFATMPEDRISRPALSERRLSLTAGGKVRYQLKTPYNNGTTHVVFEPLDFLARRAALVPRPRVNLTRYHGVFAPNSAHRALVAKGHGRGEGKEAHDLLATVCDWFKEGFDTSDLKEVKALLDKLES